MRWLYHTPRFAIRVPLNAAPTPKLLSHMPTIMQRHLSIVRMKSCTRVTVDSQPLFDTQAAGASSILYQNASWVSSERITVHLGILLKIMDTGHVESCSQDGATLCQNVSRPDVGCMTETQHTSQLVWDA